MTQETILTNAILVLRGRDRFAAPSSCAATSIADIQSGRSHAPGAIDLGGDHVIPGVVDVHTDNLERQVQPRSLARWPSRSAMVAHDAQCAAAGVTTVLDALCLGDLGFDAERIQTFRNGVVDLDALTDAGLLKADHFPASALRNPRPGHAGAVRSGRRSSARAHDQPDGPQPRRRPIRQHRFLPQAAPPGRPGRGHRRAPHSSKCRRNAPAARPQPPRAAGTRARHHASRSPATTTAPRKKSPKTPPTASASANFPSPWKPPWPPRQAGMQVIAGAPNIVRGGSHSGNVAAADLVRAGAVDAFASDYVPPEPDRGRLPVRARGRHQPARSGRHDLRPPRPDVGSARPGPARTRPQRADLVRVRLLGNLPVVRQVWRSGRACDLMASPRGRDLLRPRCPTTR